MAARPFVASLEMEMTKHEDTVNTDILAGFEALRQDVAGLVAAMAEVARKEVGAAGARAEDMVEDAKKTAVQTGADINRRLTSVALEIEATIERNPLTAMLIAFGVGLAVAAIRRPNR